DAESWKTSDRWRFHTIPPSLSPASCSPMTAMASSRVSTPSTVTVITLRDLLISMAHMGLRDYQRNQDWVKGRHYPCRERTVDCGRPFQRPGPNGNRPAIVRTIDRSPG